MKRRTIIISHPERIVRYQTDSLRSQQSIRSVTSNVVRSFPDNPSTKICHHPPRYRPGTYCRIAASSATSAAASGITMDTLNRDRLLIAAPDAGPNARAIAPPARCQHATSQFGALSAPAGADRTGRRDVPILYAESILYPDHRRSTCTARRPQAQPQARCTKAGVSQRKVSNGEMLARAAHPRWRSPPSATAATTLRAPPA